MLMKLYKTTDRDNVIRKTLTNEVEYQIKFKDRADVRTPIIVLKSDTFIDSLSVPVNTKTGISFITHRFNSFL